MATVKANKKFITKKIYTTPPFSASFPYLLETYKFNNSDTHKYKVSWELDPHDPEYLKIKKQIDEAEAESKSIFGSKWKMLYSPFSKAKSKNEKTGEWEPNGNITIKFIKKDSKVDWKTGETYPTPVTIYNRDGSLFEGSSLWGGSQIEVCYKPTSYNVNSTVQGINLEILGVKINSLVTGNAEVNPAQAFSFDEPEETNNDHKVDTKANVGDEEEEEEYEDNDPF